MKTQTQDIAPSVLRLITIPEAQLKDELPYYDKGAIQILTEADEHILAEDMPDSLPRRALIQARLAALRRKPYQR